MIRTSVSTRLFTVLLLFLLQAASSLSAADHGTGGINSADAKTAPYVVLFSIDGFRWNFSELADTPAMDHMAAEGMTAEYLQPVFPTLTFPNHYSIATGALPARHGLVGNAFPDEQRERWYDYKDRFAVQDGSWYRLEPLWVTAEKQGLVTAAYYFVGTEADISGIHPTHWRAFDPAASDGDRIEQVLAWLAEPVETRPHLITVYSEDVDENAHWYGPDSPENAAAIHRIDERLGQLRAGIAALPHADRVYLIVVSDHGQATYDRSQEVFVLDRVVDLDGIRALDGGTYVSLYFESEELARIATVQEQINRHWKHGRALTPAQAPAAWGVSDSARFPDLIVQANPGCAVLSRADMAHKITRGDHGWAPEMPEMRGIFLAAGPRIPQGRKLPPARVTDVYPLVISILGLEAPHSLDGDPARLASALLPVR